LSARGFGNFQGLLAESGCEISMSSTFTPSFAALSASIACSASM
jgi:hypothetical protein